MPLVQSLDILRQRLTNPVFKAVLDDVHEKVRGGAALSDAFGAHADLFSGVYTASLVAGERSGSLDTVLRRFVAYSKVIDTVRRKTRVGAAVSGDPRRPGARAGGDHRRQGRAGVLGFLLELQPGAAARHPGHRRGLRLRPRQPVAAARSHGAGTVVAFLSWVRQPGQRARFDRWLLRLPVLGPIAHKFATSQIARTLAALIGGGIPLVNALDTAATSTSNRHLGAELQHVAVRVREGRGFAATLLERQVLPDVAIKMIEVGESTGSLTEMLTSLADFYDEDVETEVGRFVTLIEPLLLVFMGVVIAGVVLALYLPLFQLSSVMGR